MIAPSRRLGDARAEDRAYSRSMRTPIRWVTRLAFWRADQRGPGGRGSTPTLRCSSGRPRSSVGAFDLGTTFLPRRSTGCGLRDGSVTCLGCWRLQASMAARLGDWDAASPPRRRHAGWRPARPATLARRADTADLADRRDARRRADGRSAWPHEPSRSRCRSAPTSRRDRAVRQGVGRARRRAPCRGVCIAERLFDPPDPAYHPVISCWLIADLAEAARHSDARRRPRRGWPRSRRRRAAAGSGSRSAFAMHGRSPPTPAEAG